jgi:endonuclease/exonuclease/phosphatase family metal-dependent hydrolase
MRLATWNVEWFDALFSRRDELLLDDHRARRADVSRRAQAEAAAIVLTALDADAVVIVEAPDTGGRRSTVRALEGFAARFGLRTRRAAIGLANDTLQEIALLFDPDRIAARHDPAPSSEPSCCAGDPGPGRGAGFAKPPMEMAVTPRGGSSFRLIGVHLKSRAPHGAASPADAARIVAANRQKHLDQCGWLRRRIVPYLARGTPLIVAGDLNDGPSPGAAGGPSGVAVVMGQDGPAALRLFDPHAAADPPRGAGPPPATARFWLESEGRWLDAMLDYILVSPGIAARAPRWRIWHPFHDPACRATPELRAALLTASDHFPVSLDVDP